MIRPELENLVIVQRAVLDECIGDFLSTDTVGWVSSGWPDRRGIHVQQSGWWMRVEGELFEISLRIGANHGLLVRATAQPGTTGSLLLEPMQKVSE